MEALLAVITQAVAAPLNPPKKGQAVDLETIIAAVANAAVIVKATAAASLKAASLPLSVPQKIAIEEIQITSKIAIEEIINFFGYY